MTGPGVVTVILAAGSSGRLGSPKALVRIGGLSAVRHAIESSLVSKSGRTIVVLGAEADAIRREIESMPVETVENTLFLQGRTGSLKRALEYLSGRREQGEPVRISTGGDHALDDFAVVVFPVDCPMVPSRIIDQLIDCFLERPGTPGASTWIVPEFQGRRGHPVLLAGPVLGKVLELSDDFPLRDFLHNREQAGSLRRLAIDVDSSNILDNIDTVGEFKRVLEREDKR